MEDTCILSANVNKQAAAQLSTLNDRSLKHFSALLITEPHIININNAPVLHQHRHWNALVPSARQAGPPHRAFRSLLWIHKDTPAMQIPVESSDITAAVITTRAGPLFIASVYIPGRNRNSYTEQDLHESATTRLSALSQSVRAAKVKYGDMLPMVVGGDFNRHDPVWGGHNIPQAQYSGEGEPILNWMHRQDVFSALPSGTITCLKGHFGTTIDLMLVSHCLEAQTVQCGRHGTQHGSDHEALMLRLAYQKVAPSSEARYNFRKTNWEKVKGSMEAWRPARPTIDTCEDLDNAVTKLQDSVRDCIREHCPPSKPSPYMRAWWDKELTGLRATFTRCKNWDNYLRRHGLDRAESRGTARRAQHRFHTAIRAKKRNHWNEFLAKTDNIWKAAKYLDPQLSAFGNIPSLITQRGGQEVEVTDNQEKATTLISSFFPPVPEGWCEDPARESNANLLDLDITVDEVKTALAKTSPYKAPGRDGIPNAAWKEIWGSVGQHITQIFNASYQLGHVPQVWKTARILPLRKPGKPDYRVPKAYRPISLLPTLGKLMELVLARRLSYWAETFNLLPETQFGARPRRSCDQALLLLTEKIYEAWQQKKILTLISFDVKGAYNGVPRLVLTSRLRSKGIPERVVDWVNSFCSGRSATMVVNGCESAQIPLDEAGLPQGSTLAPILYIFFNAFLMEEGISKEKGNMGFVDDYSRWAVSDSIERNMAVLNDKVVPRALQWAQDSGATFESDKTVLIHFSRNSRKMTTSVPLRVGQHTVQPSTKERILGVIFDSELRFKDHLAKVKTRGWRSASQLKRLSNLAPKAARQLYLATVASKTDYAAAVWYAQFIGSKADNSTGKILNPIQRIGAQAVVKSFRTTSVEAASAEATLLLPHFRLQMKIGKLWVGLHSLPDSNPIKMHIRKLRTARGPRTFASPIRRIEAALGRPGGVVELIPAWGMPPWEMRTANKEDKLKDRSKAATGRYLSTKSSHMQVFADGSVANGKAGIGLAAYYRRPNPFITFSGCIRDDDCIDMTSVELAAIRAATVLVDDYLESSDIQASDNFQATIWSDNQKAVDTIRQSYPISGYSIVRDIQSHLERHATLGRHISIEWIPKKAMIPGHVMADLKARASTAPGTNELCHRFAVPDSVTHGWNSIRGAIVLRARQHKWKTGNSLRSIDSAIPGRHTLDLYDILNKKEASILVQLRTGHSRLNGFLFKINISDTDQCACGQGVETSRHFLLFCPRFENQRRILANKLGPQFGNLPHMVGGRNTYTPTGESHRDGPADMWRSNISIVRETIRYALDTGRLDFGEERRKGAEAEAEAEDEDEAELSTGDETEETDEEEEEE